MAKLPKPMYCSEQIVIPEKFPNILKTYAKAVIRTQPYDLLRWSAAYFRCMATNVPPPVKVRLERDQRYGDLTRGYLRVLLEQVGKGFFINQKVLQDRWINLSLPENDLLTFLSLTRMINWPHVHWLKFFAVLVGLLSQSFRETLEMLCELLTNEPEGGPNPIPMWMFRECYVFLAELDCSSEQIFVDGRKVIGLDGELEDPTEMPDLPKVLAVDNFRNAILEKYCARIGAEMPLHPLQFVRHETDIDTASTMSAPSIASSRPSRVSSSFRFIGDYANPTEVIRRTPDFDSVILLLHESQGYTLHEYDGPHYVTEENLAHAQIRELEMLEKRDHLARQTEDRSNTITDEERNQLLQHIEPPWSWIHQFASQNCRDKSYNFLEEIVSVVSDETPSESSDESFDFENERFIKPRPPSPSIDSCEVGVEDMLLRPQEPEESDLSDEESEPDVEALRTAQIVDVNGIIDDVLQNVGLDKWDTESLLSQLESKLPDACAEEHDDSKGLNIRTIIDILRNAGREKVQFMGLEEVKAYLAARIELPAADVDGAGKLLKDARTFAVTDDGGKETVVRVNNDEKDEDNMNEGNIKGNDEVKVMVEEEKTSEEPVEAKKDPQIADKFEECYIEIDPKVAGKEVPTDMIIGMARTPSVSSVEVVPSSPPTTVPPDSPTYVSSNMNLSDVTDREMLPSTRAPSEEKLKVPMPRIPYECKVPPIHGIGKVVSPETIQNFLTYLEGRSRTKNGMVFPRFWREPECPSFEDCYEG